MFRVNLGLAALLALVLAFGFASAVEKADAPKGTCPVSGKPIDPNVSASYMGAKVYFCCGGCPDAFSKNTAKYAAKANHQLVQTGQAKQVKCPLAGRDLNPETVIEVSGVKVCFCCNNCKGKATAAKGDAQINLIFGTGAFTKGFEVKK